MIEDYASKLLDYHKSFRKKNRKIYNSLRRYLNDIRKTFSESVLAKRKDRNDSMERVDIEVQIVTMPVIFYPMKAEVENGSKSRATPCSLVNTACGLNTHKIHL